MANLKTAPDRARKARTELQAARLYNDIEYELALGEPSPVDEAAGEGALRELEDRFPGIRDEARQVEHQPALSRRASSNAHSEGRRRRATPPSHKPASRPARSPSSPPARRPGAATGRPAAIANQAVSSAGQGLSAVGDTGWGSLILEIFLGGVLLSIGYLMLTNAQGPADLASGAAKLVSTVVSPTIDPLNPPKGT